MAPELRYLDGKAYYWPSRAERQKYRRDLRARRRRQYLAWRAAHPDLIKARIRFQERTVYLATNPRTGICTACGAPITRRQHDMHHDAYDPANPVAYTRELCQTCHGKVHAAQAS